MKPSVLHVKGNLTLNHLVKFPCLETSLSLYSVHVAMGQWLCFLTVDLVSVWELPSSCIIDTGLLGNVTDIGVMTTCNGSLVTWHPPPTLVGVPITGYVLTMGRKNYTTSIAAILLTSQDVKANTLYESSIAAWNDVGVGNSTRFWFNTSAGL